MMFGPFSELTKDFSPARRARIEAIKAEKQEEEDRRFAAPGPASLEPQDDSSVARPATERPGGALRDSVGTGR